MTDRALAYILGEAIRRVLAREHLPLRESSYTSDLPQPQMVCECKPDRIVNTCSRRILEAALKLYAKECPERFWGIPY